MPASSGADDFASLTAAKERILPNRASRERPTAPSLSIPCAGSPACCTPPQRPVPVPAKVSELRRDHPATRMVVPRVQQRTNHLLHALFVVAKDVPEFLELRPSLRGALCIRRVAVPSRGARRHGRSRSPTDPAPAVHPERSSCPCVLAPCCTRRRSDRPTSGLPRRSQMDGMGTPGFKFRRSRNGFQVTLSGGESGSGCDSIRPKEKERRAD